MVSRRTILSAVTVSLAGCSLSGTDDVAPGEHVPDEWHDEPTVGNAERIQRSESADSNYKWACEETAGSAVEEYVHDRLEDDTNINPITCCEEIDGNASVVINRRIEVGSDNNVVSAPDATFEEVRQASPESVEVTIESGGREAHVCEYPVYVRDSMEQME